MNIIRIILFAIVIVIAIALVKQIKPEFTVFLVIAGSLIILGYILNWFTPIINAIEQITSLTGISNVLIQNILKIVGIGYLTEFAANICIDSGNNSIADKVQLAGKTFILIVSLPILTQLIEIISGLLQWKEKLFFY